MAEKKEIDAREGAEGTAQGEKREPGQARPPARDPQSGSPVHVDAGRGAERAPEVRRRGEMEPLAELRREMDQLFQRAFEEPGSSITVDLERQVIEAEGLVLHFEFDPFRRECLMKGLDDIGLTLKQNSKVAAHSLSTGISRTISPVRPSKMRTLVMAPAR